MLTNVGKLTLINSVFTHSYNDGRDLREFHFEYLGTSSVFHVMCFNTY